MNYKIEGSLRRNKKYFILFAILWLFTAIVLIVPWTLSVYATAIDNNLEVGLEKFLETHNLTK